MSPLVGIAVSLLPDLAKRLTKDARPGTQELIVNVVKEVLGTDDPAEAARLAQDTQLSAELRIRLAEIEAAAEAKQIEAQMAERQAQVDELKLEIESFKTELEDKQNARGMLQNLAEDKSPFAWGPVVVSVIVTVGFFATLLYLIIVGLDVDEASNPAVMQIVNIAVGALTAGFATVVSFWLGSSDGSRRKDVAVGLAQQSAVAIQEQSTRNASRVLEAQERQTAALIEKVTQPPPAAPTPSAPQQKPKDTRQFHNCVDVILKHEGGYVDHPDDPGGATNFGITHKTLANWRNASVSKQDVKNLELDEVKQIYRANYWNALNCDALPEGIDLVVFDFGVNAGITRAAKVLQKAVFVEQDGQIGPITIGAAKRIDPEHLIRTFTDARMDFYRSLSTWKTFGRGWERRTHETLDLALKML